MTKDELFLLYEKERQYQTDLFGNYKQNPSLNLASFLIFIEEYIKRAKKSYVSKWEINTPEWLISCQEQETQESSPVETYEELIKIFALCGAALEIFTIINIEKWR